MIIGKISNFSEYALKSSTPLRSVPPKLHAMYVTHATSLNANIRSVPPKLHAMYVTHATSLNANIQRLHPNLKFCLQAL